MSIEMDIRRTFFKVRKEAKKSREKLANEIGSSESAIERFENGRGMLRLDKIEKAFELFGYECLFLIRMK